jgi:Lon protease-like protein
MSELLPLFPLRLVAIPGQLVSLYIFEPRYKEMVGEAATNQSEFGIVPAVDNGISNIGCTVVVEQIGNRQPDGSFDITARGRRRFRILSLNYEKDYLRGEVEYFEAPPPGPLVNGSGRKPAVN